MLFIIWNTLDITSQHFQNFKLKYKNSFSTVWILPQAIAKNQTDISIKFNIRWDVCIILKIENSPLKCCSLIIIVIWVLPTYYSISWYLQKIKLVTKKSSEGALWTWSLIMTWVDLETSSNTLNSWSFYYFILLHQ